MPIYQGFCGPSNPSQSVLADGEETMNWYLERVQAQASPTGAALYPTPGQRAFVGPTQGVTDVGTRGFLSEVAGRAFAVVGTGFYELFALNVATRRDTVAQDNYPATISYNRAAGQLFITSGGNGYVYVLATNTLTTVGALVGKATMGGVKDGYFLCFDIVTGTVYLSALNDGTTWNTGTMFYQRSIASDPWQAMVVGNPQIWMVGEHTSEAWYNAGNFPQPFAPILSSFFQYGTKAPFSVKLAGDTLTWLAQTDGGAGSIVAATGYVPKPISNYAVDTALAGYARTATINDCEQLVYQQDGHLFACFSFLAARATWVVDLGTGAWHQRGTWDAPNSRYEAWSPRVHGYAFGKHLVGERGTGTISELDVTFGSEADGGPIRRRRVGPPLWASTKERLIIARLQLMLDTGLGLSSGQGVDPQVMLRTSGDGRRWSPERMAGAGAMGEYARRVFWTRCGSSNKLWVPEVVVTDPIPWRIAGAEIDGSGFYQLTKAA